MADILISNNPTNLAPISQDSTQVQKQQDIRTEIPDNEKLKETQDTLKQALEDRLENLQSISEDGDTLQVSPAGSSRLQENATGFPSDSDALQNFGNSDRLSSEIRNDFEFPSPSEETSFTWPPKQNDEDTLTWPPEQKDEDALTWPPKQEDEDTLTWPPKRENEDALDWLPKQEDKKDRISSSDREDKDKASATQSGSYQGYTDSELKQMYIDGEISKQDYDQELASRKEERERIEAEEQAIENRLSDSLQAETRVSQDAQQLAQAFAEDASAIPDPAERVAIMTNLQNMMNPQQGF